MILLLFVGIIGGAWAMLTILAQQERPAEIVFIGDAEPGGKEAVMIYNPDIFYNLDEQVCRAMAGGLAPYGWRSRLMGVRDARETDLSEFKLVVFCANTYNWAPDRPVSNFIRLADDLKGKQVVAITLGSGSTGRAQRLLESLLEAKGAMVMASEAMWLMKPNEPAGSQGSNVASARSKASLLGKEIAIRLEKDSSGISL